MWATVAMSVAPLYMIVYKFGSTVQLLFIIPDVRSENANVRLAGRNITKSGPHRCALRRLQAMSINELTS